MSNWIVHKFGGTSVANADCYRRVGQIVTTELKNEPPGPKGIVVSAMSKVTDALIALLELARKRDEAYLIRIEELKQRHFQTVKELLGDAGCGPILQRVRKDFEDIQNILHAVQLGRSYSEQTLELVSGYGEIWSAQILCEHIKALGKESQWLDARQVLVVEHRESGPVIDWAQSEQKLQAWLKESPAAFVVITGYIASTPDGVPTTLKRNGSDFSASIFGKLFKASEISIWTDVDGVLSADPRRVPEAVLLDEMSYQEAMELAYFGAKVVHPHTMAPAVVDGIPIWIRNTFNSAAPGTKIHKGRRSDVPVKGFSTVDGVALINVEGTGMIGVPGIANRIFGALKEVGVSVIMISQASSEHSVCFAVPEKQGELARKTVEHAFFAEIHHGQIQTVELVQHCSILAAVGDNMVDQPGVAAKFFGALGRAGINIRAIAQGSSERNISAVIDQPQSTRALRAVHSGFYLSAQTVSVGVIGPGLIGGAFLKQLEGRRDALLSQFKVDLRVRGILSSKKMLLDDRRIELVEWKGAFERSTLAADIDQFTNHIQAEHIPHAVIIDCTASPEVAALYPKWLSRGIHVITPNKKANSGPLALYRQLREVSKSFHSHYFYEATVGAGLPVITTLRDLVETGDKVLQIEGVLSGTLSYIFNTYDGSKPFSEVVKEARRLGYTEPDPRDDLSGMDVARKLSILAREMGVELEIEQIAVESLVPAPLRECKTAEEYLERLPEHDGDMAKLLEEAKAQVQSLRYVGVVTADGKASVSLRRYPSTHSFARVRGSDNIIAFQTSRYLNQALIVQGPGAGPEVTAGGVFADLLRLTKYLGAPA